MRCNGGVLVRSDCAPLERTCVTDGTAAACVDIAEPCTEEVCVSETVIRVCLTSELGSQDVDCGARLIGGTCDTLDGVAVCSIGTAECVDEEAECAGDVLRYCAAGRWIELDCSTFLGATCVRDDSGTAPQFFCTSDGWP